MERKMKITINEIAEKAGVSKATVSRVINNSKPVSEEVKKRVLGIIEDTNFKPSLVARNLALNKSHLIGIIIPDLSNPVFSRIISGIESAIRESDYSLIITATDFKFEKKCKNIEILKEKGVDGLILISDDENDSIDFFKNIHKPIVMLGSNPVDSSIPVVNIDNFSAAKCATELLIRLGHRQIGMIRGPLSDTQSGKARYLGFKQALESKELFNEEFVYEGRYSFEHGYKAMKELMSKEIPTTGVFCANDLMAVGAIRCAIDMGYKIPEDISIIGFDDVDIARMYTPSLTTVSQPFEQQGVVAVKILLDMIISNPNSNTVKDTTKKLNELPFRIIQRESTCKIK
jgi:LacI family transcriptional regulator